MISGACAAGFATAVLVSGCGAERDSVPEAFRSVPGSAAIVFVAPDTGLPERLAALGAGFAVEFGLEWVVRDSHAWLVDPSTPSTFDSLAESPTFSAAWRSVPRDPAHGDATWVFADLQAVVDGARSRLMQDLGRLVPLVDACGVSSLHWAAGELRTTQSGLALDLRLASADGDSPPCSLFDDGVIAPTLLPDATHDDRLRVEIRTRPAGLAQIVAAVESRPREGELRMDVAVTGYIAEFAGALVAQLDGRLSMRMTADGTPELAIGVLDHEDARDALSRAIPQLDSARPRLPFGVEARFEPGRLTLGRGEVGAAGSFQPTVPLLIEGRADGRHLRVTLSGDGPSRLRLHVDVD